MPRAALLLALALTAGADEYLGYLGRWVDVVATAYSPHDAGDAAYRATKGRDLHMTSGRVSDVRRVPYNIAAPLPGRGAPSRLTLPLRTQVIVPAGSGYLEGRADRVFMVDDTGGRITARTQRTGVMHIDLRVPTEADAWAYGVRELRVFVVSGRAPAPVPPPPAPQRAVADTRPPPPPVLPVADPVPPPYPWRQSVLAVGLLGLALSLTYLTIRLWRLRAHPVHHPLPQP